MDDSVVVKITANASEVAPAVEQTNAALGSVEGVVAGINSWVSQLVGKFGEAGAAGSAAGTAMASTLGAAAAATEAESAALTGMIAKVHEGAESVRTFQMRAKEFAEVYVAMFGGEQIGEFINRLAEASEKVEHLAQTFGMSVDQIQRLQGIATATGIPLDALAKGMQFLDRNMANAAMGSREVKQAMDAVGISLNDGRTQMEKLEIVADKFADMADGPKKVALAMQLFGRSGAQLIPILNMGSAGIDQLNQKMKDYGVVNDAAVEKGVQLADNVNETKLGFVGLQNTLTEALAPALTDVVSSTNEMIQSFIQSYEEGGTAREVLDALGDTIEALLTAFDALGQILSAVGKAFAEISTAIGSESAQTFGQQVPNSLNYTKQALETLKNFVVFIKDGILIAIEELKLGFIQLGSSVEAQGHVIVDALTFNWSDIEADWNAGLNAIDAATRKTTSDVVAMAKEMHDAFIGAASLADIPVLPPELQGVQAAKDSGSFDYNPTAPAKKAHEKKPKSDKPSVMEEWKQQLADKLGDEKNWGADEAQLSLQFWQNKLALTKSGSKEELEVRREISRQKLAVLKEEQADEIASIKQHEAVQLDAVKTDVALDRLALQEKLQNIDEQEKRGEISAARAIALRNDVNRQLYALDAQEEQKEYQLHLQALQDQLKLEGLKPQQRNAINRQIELLEKQHLDRMLILNQQYDSKVKADADKLRDQQIADVRNVTDAYTSSIAKMLTLQQSGIATLQSLWGSLQDTVAAVLDKILQKFAVNEAIKLGLIKTNAASTVSAEVAKAGAGGAASMAAAPWPLDMTAPAFGAQMAAVAASFGSIASAEGGWWHVTGGPAILHPDEMVLPAWAATPLRQMLSGGGTPNLGAPGLSADRSSNGDLHVTFNSVMPPKPGEMEAFLKTHHRAVGAAVRHHVRMGGSADPYRPRG